MTDHQGAPATEPPVPHRTESRPQKLIRIAQAAAALAVAAADKATEAVCASRSGSTARLEEAMHTAHVQAVEAEKYAEWAAEWAADGAAEHTLTHYAKAAADAAVHAQRAAGLDATAATLRAELEQPLAPQQHAERESERRRQEARAEAEERTATGMDEENRRQACMNRYYAEDAVPELGWTAGHLRVLEAAETGRLYWSNGQARQAAREGAGAGGRKVSSERTRALYASRFLAAARQPDGTRALIPSPMGQVALELARLYPEGLYATDRDAYQARYTQVAKQYDRSDDKKAAARRLPPLASHALRNYRRPVTLVEQELQAQRDAAEQWADEGGYCPGVQTPRPTAEDTARPAPDRHPPPPAHADAEGARSRSGRAAAELPGRPHHGPGRPGAQRVPDARSRGGVGARARVAQPLPAHREQVPVGLLPVVHVRTRSLLELPLAPM
nr:hypothetical protein [Streptomyces sp. NRRL S-87]